MTYTNLGTYLILLQNIKLNTEVTQDVKDYLVSY